MCYAYDVFVWRRRVAPASNIWKSSLAEVSDRDRAWIVANCIVFIADQPM